jgi:hypothetical protein
MFLVVYALKTFSSYIGIYMIMDVWFVCMIIWQYDIESNDIKNVKFKQKFHVFIKLRTFWKV